VLGAAFYGDGLFAVSGLRLMLRMVVKFAIAKFDRQHATSVRSPEVAFTRVAARS
jgi:hypothetical protein